MDTRYELVSFESHGEFYLVQFAIDGALTEAFWEHKSSREQHCTEDAFMSHLRSRALSLYDQFGDIRIRGPIEEIHYGQAA